MTRTVDEVWRQNRPLLTDLAFRMLDDIGEAEDAVSDAFVKLLAADLDAIEDTKGWLIVVVSRLCLDRLKSARVRTRAAMPADVRDDADPSDRVTLDDRVRSALNVLLEQLTPPERTAFVLHDVFGFDFPQVAEVVGRTPAACRQLASRARKHIHADRARAVDRADERAVTEKFIAACAGGDLAGLMEILDPDVVGQVDFGPGFPKPPARIGADEVASNSIRHFSGPDTTLVSHPDGVLVFINRTIAAVIDLDIRGGRIVDIHATGDLATLSHLVRRDRP